LYEWAGGRMNGPVEIGDVSPRRYFAIVAVVLGLLFAFVAGDDDSGPALLTSLLLWQLQSIAPMVLLLAAHVVWLRLWSFEALGPWLQLAISGITGALLFAPFAVLLDRVLEGDRAPFTVATVMAEAWNITPPITLSWLAINAPFVLGLRLRRSERSVDSPAPGSQDNPVRADQLEAGASPGIAASSASAVPAFMQLVPDTARGKLLYLQAELHYLAVVTDRGRSLILYNLRDAVDELEPASGLLTHRSYWIAYEAIAALQRRGRQGVIVAINGDEIPVSRRRIARVNAALETPRGLVA